MLKRDYFMKQIEEFGRVLGTILGLKLNRKLVEMENLIKESALKYTSTEIEHTECISNETLIISLVEQHKLNDEQLKILADLLFEKAEYYILNNAPEIQSSNCYRKAFIIYSFLNERATLNYSLDMHYKLEILSRMFTK